MQKHRPTDQIQPQEHREGEDEVDRNSRRFDREAIRHDCCTCEVGADRRRVDGADDQLTDNLYHHGNGHRNPPIVHTIVDSEQLWNINDNEVERMIARVRK